jgi:hypothetical protein
MTQSKIRMERMRIPVRWLIAAALAFLGGCSGVEKLTGADHGYVFTGLDALALPGQTVYVSARLESGRILRDQPGHVVTFYLDDKLYQSAATDEEGVATVAFTPDKPGNYRFRAALSPKGLSHAPPEPVTVLVACRRADEPIIIVDLDRTIVADGYKEVVKGTARPMRDSQAVLAKLSKRYTVVYLTQRPEFLDTRSKVWLRGHDYPEGPLLASEIKALLKSNESYKSREIANLAGSFRRIEFGIGDKSSDAKAYAENGLRPYLILHPKNKNEGDLRGMADSLRKLPSGTQVVTNWREIEAGIFRGESFPAERMRIMLYRMADELKAAKKATRPAAPSQ